MFGKEKLNIDELSPEDAEAYEDETAVELDLSGPVALDLGAIRDELIPEGWHVVEIERAEPKRSRQKRLAQIFILSRITDEADPDFRRTVIWNIMMEGDGMVFTKRCFKALGMSEQLSYPSYEALAQDLIGRQVEVRIKHKSHEGQKQAQVNNWREVTPDVVL